jgi:hypothetical protein
MVLRIAILLGCAGITGGGCTCDFLMHLQFLDPGRPAHRA